MKNVNKNEFIDIYTLKILNEIKKSVKRNIILDKDREKEIDKKMLSLLKNLSNKNSNKKQLGIKKNNNYNSIFMFGDYNNEELKLTLVLYYTALYYDSVDLLKDLIKENVKFKDDNYINLQYLDKAIYSKFDRKEYINMIKQCGIIFKNFTESIERLSKEEKEQYIERFENIIRSKFDLIKETLKDRNLFVKYALTKENLDKFTDETYMHATKKQLSLIDRCRYANFSEQTKQRLNNLLQTHNYERYFCNFDLIFSVYTDEQLMELTPDIARAIDEYSMDKKGLDKIIDFVQKRPDLSRIVLIIPKETFFENDNYSLIEHCDYCIKNNCGLKELQYVSNSIKRKTKLKKTLGIYKKVYNK